MNSFSNDKRRSLPCFRLKSLTVFVLLLMLSPGLAGCRLLPNHQKELMDTEIPTRHSVPIPHYEPVQQPLTRSQSPSTQHDDQASHQANRFPRLDPEDIRYAIDEAIGPGHYRDTEFHTDLDQEITQFNSVMFDDQRFVEAASFQMQFEDAAESEFSFDEPVQEAGLPKEDPLFIRILHDHQNFYSPESLSALGLAFAGGAIVANTNIDDGIIRHFQVSTRRANSDEWYETFRESKGFGDGRYSLSVYGATWLASELFPEVPGVQTAGTWGERSLRAFLVGAPPLIGLQFLTGGSRPGETEFGSAWRPFQDNNGVSGHAFVGSLPFITAAKMSESPGWKFAFYAASTLAPISRSNDGSHYPSQAFLGWFVAYVAASAVDASDNPDARWKFFPYVNQNGTGIQAEIRY